MDSSTELALQNNFLQTIALHNNLQNNLQNNLYREVQEDSNA